MIRAVASVALGALCSLALLLFAERTIAGIFQRNPDAFSFILSPWVAPVLIVCGIAILGGTAAMLVFLAPFPSKDGSK